MSIQAALFDLDGTLVDSLADLTSAVNHIRENFANAPLSAEVVRLMIGKGSRNLIQQVLPTCSSSEIERALKLFLEYNTQHIVDKSRLYPGIRTMLDTLADGNITMAVISNKNEALCHLILKALSIDHLFSAVCGGDTLSERKPSPLPLLHIMSHYSMHPAATVMIGDSINDMQAGFQAGVATIGCRWGYATEDELSTANAVAVTPLDIVEIIFNGFG
jgi:phosphoglycolate phosphatase